MHFTTTILLALGTLIGNAQAVVKGLDLSSPQEALTGNTQAVIKGLDLSSPQGTSVWTCVQRQSFLKGVPRLYQEACGNGGRIDPTFITSYNQIRASGITNIDAYFYPCTSSAHHCKSPQTQVNEIVNYLKAHNILVKRLWLDLEPPNSGSPCKGWNYGATRNTALAKQFVAAMKATGLKWGIYANGNQWATMFGSRNVNIASDLPLWAAQWDGVPTLESVRTFMGGWTKAFAKQYGSSTGGCAHAGAFDLNVFKE